MLLGLRKSVFGLRPGLKYETQCRGQFERCLGALRRLILFRQSRSPSTRVHTSTLAKAEVHGPAGAAQKTEHYMQGSCQLLNCKSCPSITVVRPYNDDFTRSGYRSASGASNIYERSLTSNNCTCFAATMCPYSDKARKSFTYRHESRRAS